MAVEGKWQWAEQGSPCVSAMQQPLPLHCHVLRRPGPIPALPLPRAPVPACCRCAWLPCHLLPAQHRQPPGHGSHTVQVGRAGGRAGGRKRCLFAALLLILVCPVRVPGAGAPCLLPACGALQGNTPPSYPPHVCRVMLLAMLLGPNTIAGALGVPVMTIGVKRYTHEGNRGFAFSLFYSLMNVAALTQVGWWVGGAGGTPSQSQFAVWSLGWFNWVCANHHPHYKKKNPNLHALKLLS